MNDQRRRTRARRFRPSSLVVRLWSIGKQAGTREQRLDIGKIALGRISHWLLERRDMLAIGRGDPLGLGKHCGIGGGIHDSWRSWLLQHARGVYPAERRQDARKC